MATSFKSPHAVLELPEGASLEAVEAAYARGLKLLDEQSLAAYGMFDPQSAGRLRDELTTAYQALKTTAQPQKSEPVATSQGAEPNVAAPKIHEPPCAVTAPPKQQPALPEEVAAPAWSAPRIAPEAAAAPPAPVSTIPPPAAMTQSNLRVRLCAPRAEPLEEPLSGAVLRQLREQLGAEVDDVCEVTKINRRYILALEEEDFSLLPATVYVRGFIGEYARALGLASQATVPYLEAYTRWSNARA